MLAEHTQALHKGARLSQYEIGSVLGSGGFGITYLARDTALDAPVAIKEYLPTELAARQSDSRVTAVSTSAVPDFNWGLQRFLEEARVLAKFRHPHIVHVFQIFEANNTAYIVMEYAKGEPLSSLIQRAGSLGEAQTRDILVPIMDGLKRVHERGFLHRDIKPGNIILREEGGPALIDFGAARQAIETKSRSITSIVTEGYAPLEQYDPNGNQGPWTDIYALGAVAYKCLTGKTPPAATSRVRNDPLVPLQTAAGGRVSEDFDAAVCWALAVYEEDRPQSIEVLSDAFVNGMPAVSGSVQAEATQRLTQGMRRAQPTPLGAAAAAAGSGVAISGPAFAGEFGKRLRISLLIAGGAILVVGIFLGLRLFSQAGTDHAVPNKAPPLLQSPTGGAPASTKSQNPTAQPANPAAEPVPASPLAQDISGAATVIDTATLQIDGRRVVLAGVTGLSGQYSQIFSKTLAEFGGMVRCTIKGDGPAYQCTIAMAGDRQADLSEMALLNGAAVTTADADAAQKADEAQAKSAGRGIWANTNSSSN